MAQPKKYLAEVVSVINHVENIYSVEFKSLSGRFKFQPGQFLHLALDEYDPSSGWPESRCFSIQSSPVNEILKITFTIKGNFTGRMASEIVKRKIVSLKLPYGELFQREHSKNNVVFIAGGTGITPFLSYLTQPCFSEYKNPKLYLGLRNKSYNIYMEELSTASWINKDLQISIKYQDISGILSIEEIFNENTPNSIFYISGPQLMISTFRTKLKQMGVRDEFIHTDEWE